MWTLRPQTGSERGAAGRLGAVKAERPELRPQHHLKKKKPAIPVLRGGIRVPQALGTRRWASSKFSKPPCFKKIRLSKIPLPFTLISTRASQHYHSKIKK